MFATTSTSTAGITLACHVEKRAPLLKSLWTRDSCIKAYQCLDCEDPHGVSEEISAGPIER
jgi:hypothetical protein